MFDELHESHWGGTVLMSQQSHRRQLQQVLTQTITMLCRNSLPFATQFSVEGLLGITLDRDEVFLINIQETVNKYAPDLVRHPSEESLHSPGHERLATNNAQRGSREVYPSKLPKIKQDPSAFHTELPVTSPPRQAHSVPPKPTVIKRRADHMTSRRNRRDSEVINNNQRILQNAKMEMEDKTPQFQKPPPVVQHHQMPVFPGNEQVLNFSMNKPDVTQLPDSKREVNSDVVIREFVTVAPELIEIDREEDDECNAAADLFKWHETLREVLEATGMAETTEENYEEAMSVGVEAVMSTCQLSDSSGMQCPMCLDILRSQYHLRQHLRTHVGSVLPYPVSTQEFTPDSPATDNETPEPPPSDTSLSDPSDDSLSDDDWLPEEKTSRRSMSQRNGRFKCKVCGLRSKSRSNMQNHMYTHTGEKPHRCPDCGKGFRQAGALSIHKLVHTGERPHTCPVCAKGFITSSQLRKHMQAHTGELQYRCAHCQEGFMYLRALKSHVLDAHSILPVSSSPRTTRTTRSTSNGSVDREGTPRPSSQPNPSPDQNLVKDIGRPTHLAPERSPSHSKMEKNNRKKTMTSGNQKLKR